MIALLLLLNSLATGTVHRCGLEGLPAGWTPSSPPLKVTSKSAQVAARSLATTSSLETTHFKIWWANSAIDVDAIQGAGPRTPLPGDSVPALARTVAKALENAWHLYVDSLGYLPPKPTFQGYHWGMVPPPGKYPVEICKIGLAYFGTTKTSYFGLTIPYSDNSSSMLLASDLYDFGQWSYDRDLDGLPEGSDYSLDWANVMNATVSHEEFHSVQFNYETNLNHFLFEASAVAMEKVAVPTESDYLAFADSSRQALGLCDLYDLTPLLKASNATAYPHAWYVQQIMGDFGRDILRKLWESRARSPGSIKNSLVSVLATYNQPFASFDTTLARYALRLGLSGRRYGWLQPNFSPFSDAKLFPTLNGSLSVNSSPEKVPLDLSAFQEWIDTSGSTDRIVDWIPDAGAQMGHAWKNTPGAGMEWLRGSIRQPASAVRQDVWSMSNPGPLAALRALATSEASTSYLWTSSAPVRTPVTRGHSLSWSDGAGATLSGIFASDSACTPLLHTDIWKPTSSEDPFAASISGRTNGHAFVLEDADRMLDLKGSTLTVPYTSLTTVWIGRGDGIWVKAASSPSGSSTTIFLDSLDLSIPMRILAAPGNSPRSMIQAPRPNPSRNGAFIHFPISGATNGARLEILSADGTVIRRLEASVGATDVVWDVRGSSGNRVRPGVYWYVWRGVDGANRGELLVAD